jgi:hypothetical protein
MIDHLTSRAQRLIEEFEEGENVRHGLANVLEHLAAAFGVYCDGEYESMVGVSVSTLDELAVELTAPTLLDRALAGDKTAATQFLQELGMIDEHGQLTGIYAPEPISQED